ncbi:MAG: polysaccharide biosynthesis/export family protein [Bacteroidales bacterium]|nr:polysaccharide biosynthesis/export family protein [Bacteroidales bacterium]
MHKHISLRLFLGVAAAMLFASCVTHKDITYLQDMPHDSSVKLDNSYEARIHPNDELTIYITSSDREAADPFNLLSTYNSRTGGSYSSQNPENTIGYLVDINGYIDMPSLGRIKVDGMTRLQLQDTINSMLKKGGYLAEPVVLVRFKNYKIYIKSATGSQTVTVTNERVTLLEALSQAGNISAYTKLDKVGVLREEGGQIHLRYLNLKSKDVFNDPYFLLQQNDVVLLEPLRASRIKENASWIASYASLTTSLITIVTLILTLVVPKA